MTALLALSAEARADDLQNQLLASAKATRADAFSFRRTVTTEETGSPRKNFIELFDPRQPAGTQWSLTSVDGRAPTPKELDQARASKPDRVPSYNDIARWFGAPATRSDGPIGYVIYRFAALPKGVFKINSHDASADSQAEALVNVKGATPFVEQVKVTSTKSFSMMLVASIKSIAVTNRYRQLSDGSAVPDGSSSEIAGSMLGRSGSIKTAMTYSDVQKVR